MGYGGTPEEATRRFVGEILGSRLAIVISRVNGKIRDFAVPAEFDWDKIQASLAKYGFPGETVEARYWDERAIEGVDPARRDGLG